MSQPLFAREPRTEQEVVCLFGALLNELDIPLPIKSVQTAFPDCTAGTSSNKPCYIEFELFSSHYRLHRHPLDGCAIVVCWRDDAGDLPMRVVELAEVVSKHRPDIIASISEWDHAPCDEPRFFKQAIKDGATERDLSITHRIIEFARAERLGPRFLKKSLATFAIGDHDPSAIRGKQRQFFKVDSSGRIGFPFSRLGAGPVLRRELFNRLNTQLPSLKLTMDDTRSKGKGGLLCHLFDTDERVELFLETWKWFRDTANTTPTSGTSR